MDVAVSLKLTEKLLISTVSGSKILTLYGIQSGLTDRWKHVVLIRSAGITDRLAHSCAVLHVQCRYYALMRCCIMCFSRWTPVLRRNFLLSSSGYLYDGCNNFSETLVTTHQTRYCHNAEHHDLGCYSHESANVTGLLEFH
jgi:hypothetical protein